MAKEQSTLSADPFGKAGRHTDGVNGLESITAKEDGAAIPPDLLMDQTEPPPDLPDQAG